MDNAIKKIASHFELTSEEIELICPNDASENYKLLIRTLSRNDDDYFIYPIALFTDINSNISGINYFIKFLTNKGDEAYLTFTCLTLDEICSFQLLNDLLEKTSMTYYLILEFSKHQPYVSDGEFTVFRNNESYFRKDLCQFLLEDPTDDQLQNLAEKLAVFATPDTFRIVYEVKELDLRKCLQCAAITNNTAIVQLLLRDPRLKLDHNIVDLLVELVIKHLWESFKLVFEAYEELLTKEDISIIINKVANYSLSYDNGRLEVIKLIKGHVNYSEV